MKTWFIFLFSVLVLPSNEGKISIKVYQALSGDSQVFLDQTIEEINLLDNNSLNRAYKGTLTAKSASFLKKAGEKIQVFKKGVSELENEITTKPNEVEYRFLRLAIQEKSPKFLGYSKNLEEDKKMILENFNSLPHFLKNQLKLYASKSTIISTNDLTED